MRKHSVNRKKERKDDMLPPIKICFERVSADHMYNQKDQNGPMHSFVSFTIREMWSGVMMAFPRRSKNQDANRNDLRHFFGRRGPKHPII